MMTIPDILKELEKVRLEPLLLTAMKAIDPYLGALPKGSLEYLVNDRGTRNGIVNMIEQLTPVLPGLIRFLGTLAESRLITGLFKLSVRLMTPISRMIAPFVAKPMLNFAGTAVSFVGRIIPAIPSVVKVLNVFWKTEVMIEKGVKRFFPA